MAAFGGWRLTRTGILFVIGIIVLGGLVTGGIFLVKNHGEAVRRDQAVKIAEQNLKNQSQTATQPVNAPSSDSAGTKTTDTSAAGGSASGSSDGSATNSTAPTSGTAPATNGPSASELPVTGINDFKVVGTSFILAIVAFSVVSYVASRRAADHL